MFTLYIPSRFSGRFRNRSHRMWTMLWKIEPDRTAQELSCLYRTGSIFIIFYFGLAKETYPLVQESDNEIPFQKRGRSAEQPVHTVLTLGAERYKNLSNTELITFVPGHNRHKSRAGPVGPRVNRKLVSYGFWGAPIIHPGKLPPKESEGGQTLLELFVSSKWRFSNFSSDLGPIFKILSILGHNIFHLSAQGLPNGISCPF